MLNIKSNLMNKKLTETIQQTTTQNDVCLLKEMIKKLQKYKIFPMVANSQF